MKNIIIVSKDICAIKQIINTIDKTKKLNASSVKIYDIDDFRNYILSSSFNDKNTLYFIDIYDIEHEFLDLLKSLNIKDNSNKIIVLNTNSNLKSLLESQKEIYAHLEKDLSFETKLSSILHSLSNDEPYKINVTDTIPVIINKQDIDNIYKWPGQKLSINYKDGDNSLLFSLNNCSNKIKKITNNRFYTDKITINNSKRKQYSEPLKQLLVDLYLILHIDYKELSLYFNIDARYIKKWSTLSKYNRKINVIHFIVLKLIVKLYLRKHKGGR